MIAHVVAAPVRERLGDRTAVVGGGGRRAAYAELDGFVVALTARGVPLMPNGIGLAGAPPAAGERVAVRPADAPTWEPALVLCADPARRGAELLAALGAEPPADELARAVADGDAELAARAAHRLVGLGPGLTPAGDDRLAATAAVLAARGRVVDWLPRDLRRRTSALSATLLELAAAGRAIEPLHGLFGPRWPAALARLVRIGGTTGRTYATAAATAALLS